MSRISLIERGSLTAKNGFKNERELAEKFNNWQIDTEAQLWLEIMNYNLKEIEFVKAVVLSGYKADLNIQVQIKLKEALDAVNIQVKLVSNKQGFNQIDKRYLKSYTQLWDMPKEVYALLQLFTGEVPPRVNDTKDKRRMFMTEFTEEEQKLLIDWFCENKFLIISDCIKGRGEFSAEWVLVAQKLEDTQRWVLKNINEVLNIYFKGEVKISPRGSVNIGGISMQRKGGDGGRKTANMLQFKMDPIKLFED